MKDPGLYIGILAIRIQLTCQQATTDNGNGHEIIIMILTLVSSTCFCICCFLFFARCFLLNCASSEFSSLLFAPKGAIALLIHGITLEKKPLFRSKNGK